MPLVNKNSLSLVSILIGALLLSGCGQPQSKALKTNEHSVDGAFSAYLSNDGKYSLVSSIHHGLALWDIEKNALKYQWSHQGAEDNFVLATYIAHDNTYALSADKTNFVLWNMESGESEGFWQVRDSQIRDVALAKGGHQILIGKRNGVVVHIDKNTGRRLEFLGHQEKINSVDISPNGKFALSGSNDYVAYLWDTTTGQVIYRFNHPSRVTKVALDPKGRYAFTADSKKQSKIWDLQTGQAISQLQYTSRSLIFSAVRFSDDGKFIATGSPSRKLALWDVTTGEQVKSWYVAPRKETRPKSSVVYSVSFVNNGAQLLTESSSGLAELWSIK